MSDEESDDDYEYEYSDDESAMVDNENDGDGVSKCPRNGYTSDVKGTNRSTKYMEADLTRFNTWAGQCPFRLSIVSAIRQIVDHPCDRMSILCLDEELTASSPIKKMRVFVYVLPSMTVTYELSFNSSVKMNASPPKLKCMSYCGEGTYLFPELLLPNRFGQFIHFGKMFHFLCGQLEKYHRYFDPFHSFGYDDLYYLIQELAFQTQYVTKFVFSFDDSGIVTGIERESKVKPLKSGVEVGGGASSSGVGYSSGAAVTFKRDNTYADKLSSLLEGIGNKLNKDALNSPLIDLVTRMVSELSIEEVTKCPYAKELFKLISAIQLHISTSTSVKEAEEGQGVERAESMEEGNATEANPSSSSSSSSSSLTSSLDSMCLSSYQFPDEMFHSLYHFKQILVVNNQEILEDEYCLSDIKIPLHVETAITRERETKKLERTKHLTLSSPTLASASTCSPVVKNSPVTGNEGAAELVYEPVVNEPVTIVERFSAHSYMKNGKHAKQLSSFASKKTALSSSSAKQDMCTCPPRLLRRINVELSTLNNLLPPTIRVMALEENMRFFKFMISGPPDTPYQGGYFIFDMVLPMNYPQSPPEVLLITTGSGQVRFNPNLYNCGKVCLSLLGTWQGEKWDPEHSNLNQVIQSICYLIFVEHPYFNEPGFQDSQGTKQGDSQSQLYTANIRASTIQFALLEHLISPNVEFGATIKEFAEKAWNQDERSGGVKALFNKWAKEEVSSKVKTDMLNNIGRIDAIINSH